MPGRIVSSTIAYYNKKYRILATELISLVEKEGGVHVTNLPSGCEGKSRVILWYIDENNKETTTLGYFGGPHGWAWSACRM